MPRTINLERDLEIYRRHSNGERVADLAPAYKLSRGAIYDAIHLCRARAKQSSPLERDLEIYRRHANGERVVDLMPVYKLSKRAVYDAIHACRARQTRTTRTDRIPLDDVTMREIKAAHREAPGAPPFKGPIGI